MDFVELPLVDAYFSPLQSVGKMLQKHVSACIVRDDTDYHLLKLDRVVECLTEWSAPPSEIGRLIIPDELTGGLPELSGDVPALMQIAAVGLRVGEAQLDGYGRRYGLVTKRTTPTTAFVATRSERLAIPLRSPLDYYKCTLVETHIYRADKLGGVLQCPNVAHIITPPKPPMVKL
jgi:hypothetical protein